MAVFSNNTNDKENLKIILFMISPDIYYNTLRKCLQYGNFLLQYEYEIKEVTQLRKLIEEEKMVRTIRRISHEIIERNNDLSDIVLIGVLNNGVPLAELIQENIKKIEDIDVPMFQLDISGYRDDISVDNFAKLEVDLTSKVVILVDDVLFTGRTVRASMDAIVDLGRPSKIQLAVLIDRGHRELPVRADYVGKNMPTSLNENVRVNFITDIGVFILNNKEKK